MKQILISPAFADRFLFLVGLMLALLLPMAPAQAEKRLFTLPPNQKSVQLPIKVIHNLVVVQAVLNHSTSVNLILDTGTPAILLTDPKISKKLIRPGSPMLAFSGPGAGEKPVVGQMLTGQVLNLGAIEGKNVPVVALRETPAFFRKVKDTEVHGILGYPFLYQFVVTIDYARLVLTIADSKHYQPDPFAQALPFRFENSKPVLSTTLTLSGQVFPLRLLVDTGASHGLLLDAASAASADLLPHQPRTHLGSSFGGDIYGRKGLVRDLELAGLELPKVMVSMPDAGQYAKGSFANRHGSIGGDLLQHFLVTIDFPGETLYLGPNKPEKLVSLSRPEKGFFRSKKLPG